MDVSFVCGSNGAGKSTFSAALRADRSLLVIDPDAIARENSIGLWDAGRITLQCVDRAMASRHGFLKESTLSSLYEVRLLHRTSDAGCRTHLIFLGLDSAELAVERVRQRVLRGGHGVPQNDIIRRRIKGLSNLPGAIKLAGSSLLYDNTADSRTSLAAVFEHGRLVRHEFTPDWLGEALQMELKRPETERSLAPEDIIKMALGSSLRMWQILKPLLARVPLPQAGPQGNPHGEGQTEKEQEESGPRL